MTRRAIEQINPEKTLPLHVSLDIDVLDPSEAPATGTPGKNGIVNSKWAHIGLLHIYKIIFISYR